MRVTLDLPNDVKWENLAKEVQAAVDLNLAGGVKLVENDAKKAVARGPKTGRIYKRRGVTHQASAPGQAPATDTGMLARNIVSSAKDGVAVVEARTKYAVHLEYGTRRTAARPFLTPAVERNRARIQGLVRSAVALGAERWAKKQPK